MARTIDLAIGERTSGRSCSAKKAAAWTSGPEKLSLYETDHSTQRRSGSTPTPSGGKTLTYLDDYWVAKAGAGEPVRPEFWAPWESGRCSGSCSVSRSFTTPSSPNDVIPKSAAGTYALNITDEYWHDVVQAAMALRNRPAGPTPEGTRCIGRRRGSPRKVAHRRCPSPGRRVSCSPKRPCIEIFPAVKRPGEILRPAEAYPAGCLISTDDLCRMASPQRRKWVPLDSDFQVNRRSSSRDEIGRAQPSN